MSDDVAPRTLRDRLPAIVLALVVPVAAILIERWFDNDVLQQLRRETGAHFDLTPMANGLAIGFILIPVLTLAIAIAGWRSRSALVGVAYVLVGALITLDPPLFAALAISRNGAPPPAPEPVAAFLSDVFMNWESGVTSGVGSLGGTLLVVGAVLIIRAAVDRRGRNRVSVRPIEPAPPDLSHEGA